MKLIFSLFTLIYFTNVFAETNNYESQLEEPTRIIERYTENEIGNANTCLDEYLQREQQLKKYLIWTPPAAVIGVPASTYLGLATGAGIAHVFNVGGWSGLGYVIGGGMIGFGASTIGVVGFGTWAGVSFAKNRSIIHVIVESNLENPEGRKLKKFFKSYKKKYPEDSIDIIDFSKAVSLLDETGRLCDGSLRGQSKAVKLSKKLARKKDIFSAIHKEFGHPLIAFE